MSNVWDPLLPRRHSSVARVYYSASESSKHASAAEGGGRLPMARTITWLQLMMIVYFNTVGGAFGIEPAVGAGGPLFCLIAVVLVSLALAAPQALMSAELSLLCDVNGGSYEWVYRGLGPFAAYLNAVNMFGQEFVSNALLLVLFPAYSPTQLSWWHSAWLMLGVSVLFGIINLFGNDAVSSLNYVFTPLMIVPFVIVYLVAMHENKLAHEPFGTLGQMPPLSSVKLSVFFGVLIWNIAGYDCVGYFAGEVKGGRSAYIKGLAGALMLGILTYVIPIICFYMIAPNYHNWTQGYLTTVAYQVSRGCGVLMVVTAMISTAGMFGSSVFPLVRAVAEAANVEEPDRQLFPRIVGWSLRSKAGVVTPVAAIIFTTIVTWLMALGPYEIVVESYLMFFLVNLGFEYASLFALRITEPDTLREFKIPGGFAMLIVMVLPVVASMGALIATADPLSLYIGLGAQPVIMVIYLIVRGQTASERQALADARARKAAVDAVRDDDDDDDVVVADDDADASGNGGDSVSAVERRHRANLAAGRRPDFMTPTLTIQSTDGERLVGPGLVGSSISTTYVSTNVSLSQ